MRKTKIICTLGPASSDIATIKSMIEAGMDVARLNMSHSTHESHQSLVDIVKGLREKMKKPVAIMIDTKGPEIRVGKFPDGRVFLNKGRMFTLTTSDLLGNESIASITYKGLPKLMKEGDPILLSDGLIELKVVSVTKYDILCKIIEGGELTNNKSINLPNIKLDMPYMSDTDKRDILFAIENDVEYIAISFVRSAADVELVRDFIKKNNGKNIKLISKIENEQGVDNIDEIIKASDGIMIARGDLGVEVDFKRLPTIQKNLINKCAIYGKISITATQMLESMISSFRPTRAEISDVANAVLDGSSCVMLSGETAVGGFVAKTTKTMCEIIRECESNFNAKINTKELEMDIDDISENIAYAATSLSYSPEFKAILALTLSGKSACDIASFKPRCDIIACACDDKVFNQLAMVWGVKPVHVNYGEESIDELIASATKAATKKKLISKGDTVIITAGIPFGKSKSTNLLKIETV